MSWGAVGAIAAVVGALVGVLAWQFPHAADDDAPVASATTPQSSATLASGLPPASGQVARTPVPVYLAAQAPQAGGANLVQLPRPLASQSGYDQAVVISCPSNQTSDQVREVTYQLRGRYLDFSANVQPYFAAQQDARTDITALASYRERDGTLTRKEQGRQPAATMAVPLPLHASVDGADELTLQVRCENPEGMVVLVAAQVTPTT
ncbi:MAG: hypothetical protein JXA67_01785 [Micromonosporaceae bacterium]|nr:hypothetical protein [Micromonosporaceae bacterium]